MTYIKPSSSRYVPASLRSTAVHPPQPQGRRSPALAGGAAQPAGGRGGGGVYGANIPDSLLPIPPAPEPRPPRQQQRPARQQRPPQEHHQQRPGHHHHQQDQPQRQRPHHQQQRPAQQQQRGGGERARDASPRLARDMARLTKAGKYWGSGVKETRASSRRGELVVDLAFLLDGTGSMKPHLATVKDKIRDVVRSMGEQYPGLRLRLAMVIYRDLDYAVEYQVEDMDFTEDPAEFERFLGTARTMNRGPGGDFAEDVLGGLHALTELSWSSSIRVLYHVCDAPCHGQAFHDLPPTDGNDRYRTNSHPHGLTAERVLKASIVDLQLDYNFASLTKYTDKMIARFGELLSPHNARVVTRDVDDGRGLIRGLEASLHDSISDHQGLRRKKAEAEASIVRGMPTWHTIVPEPAREFTLAFPTAGRPICAGRLELAPSQRELMLRAAARPFAVGSIRTAHFAQAIYLSAPGQAQTMVTKQYLCEEEAADLGSHVRDMEAHTVAAYLANGFSSKTADCARAMRIKFGVCRLVVLTDRDAKQGRYALMERHIESEYFKFIGAAGTSIKLRGVTDPRVAETLQAFCHYTYESENEYLLVVDLQGTLATDQQGRSQLFLTDPAIHCTDRHRFDDKTNHGVHGIARFFRHHRCNAICRHLGLPDRSATIAEEGDEHEA